jgi:hypothetical protein
LEVVAVEEPTFLLAVERVVGGVEIEDDLFERLFVGLEESVHEEPVHHLHVHLDLFVALVRRGFGGGELEPVQRALAGRRREVPLAHQGREERIAAKFVVIGEILATQDQAADPLGDKFLDGVLDRGRIRVIHETAGEGLDEAGLLRYLADQERAAI